MNSDFTYQPTDGYKMDISNPSPNSSYHHSRKGVLIASIVLIILAAILIGLRIKAYNDYLKTPLGELEALSKTSQPITKTPAERQADLLELRQNSAPVTMTKEERLQELQALQQ